MQIYKKELDNLMGVNREGGLTISDLRPYAKGNCKKCLGKGYLKFVKADGSFLKNEICFCVWKSKNISELLERLHAKKEEEKVEENDDE
jgi:hypothetical protein